MTAWQVVVPFRGRDRSKTRLALPATAGDLRPRLARAFVLDVVAACLDTPEVAGITVVSSDHHIADCLSDPRVELLPDPGGGLNPAVAAGAAEHPERNLAVLTGDLPTLTAGDLGSALSRTGQPRATDSGPRPAERADGRPRAATSSGGQPGPRWFVGDLAGTGTTSLFLPPGSPAEFAFGPDSARLHRALGYRDLGIDADSTLRFDVDTIEDLLAALARGVGPHTAALAGLLLTG